MQPTYVFRILSRVILILCLFLPFLAHRGNAEQLPDIIILRAEIPFPGLAPLTLYMAQPKKLTAGSHPIILYFTGGGQEERYARRIMQSILAREAVARGYIFISPAAPCYSCTFVAKGDLYFPALFDLIKKELPMQGEKFHLMGFSNGGRSSLHLASLYPDRIASVTTFPGYLRRAKKETVAALVPLCISMHVGRDDVDFLKQQRRLIRRLKKAGREIHAVEYSREGHSIRALNGIKGAKMILDNIENGIGCPEHQPGLDIGLLTPE